MLYDLLPVVSFRGWPAVAQGWLTANHFWDGKITEEEAISGFYLLPCCSPLGGRPDREWRLAFSRSEVRGLSVELVVRCRVWCHFIRFESLVQLYHFCLCFVAIVSPIEHTQAKKGKVYFTVYFFPLLFLLLPGSVKEVHPLPHGPGFPSSQSCVISNSGPSTCGPQPLSPAYPSLLGL